MEAKKYTPEVKTPPPSRYKLDMSREEYEILRNVVFAVADGNLKAASRKDAQDIHQTLWNMEYNHPFERESYRSL